MTKSEQSKVVQAMLRKLLKDAMTLAELTGRKPQVRVPSRVRWRG